MARTLRDACALSVSEVESLWRKYRAHPRCTAHRDRLVEHYFPWFSDLAGRMARRMSLEDRDDAVGEACLALAEKIVPSYDGRRPFENFAMVCLKNLFRSFLRRRHGDTESIEPYRDLAIPCPSVAAVEPTKCETLAIRMMAGLSNAQATVLWLRFSRGVSIEQTAAMLNIPPGTVKSRTSTALKILRKRAESGDFAA